MRIDATTITDYFLNLPMDRKDAMQRIRMHIRSLWPQVMEDLAYGMPTFHHEGRALFALASQKHYVVFYVVPYDLLEPFKHELLMYNCGKSCIRLREVDDKALALLDRVIRFVGATHMESKLRLKPVMKAVTKRKPYPAQAKEPLRARTMSALP